MENHRIGNYMIKGRQKWLIRKMWECLCDVSYLRGRGLILFLMEVLELVMQEFQAWPMYLQKNFNQNQRVMEK